MSDTQKSELIATHPETGKRHRWEVGIVNLPKRGEAYLTGDVKVAICELDVFMSYRLILRDLGPVEEDRVSRLADRLLNATERINLAMDALRGRGYFNHDEVSEDVAPRIVEMDSARCQIIASLKSQLTESRHQVTDLFRERAELKTTIAILKARIDNATAELERLSPAPCPVGVVRLPIGNPAGPVGTFEIAHAHNACPAGEWFLKGWFMGAPPLVAGQYDLDLARESKNLVILRRLDASEEKTPEKPAPCSYCGGKGTDPLDGRWECRKCDGTGVEKPAPPKEEGNLSGPCPSPFWTRIWTSPHRHYSPTLDHC